jgi:sec-independent protein translocase protein TatB
VFNVTGGEIIIVLLIALVVLGPDKLPGFIRSAGRMYSELRKMATGFKAEFDEAMAEPMREMRETADMAKTWLDSSMNTDDDADDADLDEDALDDGDDEVDGVFEDAWGDMVDDDPDVTDEDEDGDSGDDVDDDDDDDGDDPNFYDADGNLLDAAAIERLTARGDGADPA